VGIYVKLEQTHLNVAWRADPSTAVPAQAQPPNDCPKPPPANTAATKLFGPTIAIIESVDCLRA
jgi:hypothetical protein